MDNIITNSSELCPDSGIVLTGTDYKTFDYNITKAVAFLDSDLRFVKTRINFRRFLGAKNEHRCLFELIDNSNVQGLRAGLGAVSTTAPFHIITEMLRVDGQRRRVMLQFLAAEKGSDYAYSCILFDLYNLAEYTDALEMNTLKYKCLLENYDSVYYEYNSKTQMFSLISLDSMSEIVLCSSSLSEIYARVDNMPDEDKSNLMQLCKALEKGDSLFEYSFTKNPFKHSAYDSNVLIMGRCLRLQGGFFLILGQISPYNSELKNTPYSTNVKNMDIMTGLLNKKAVLSFTRTAIEERRYKQIFLMMIDLDNFKLVNDNYGHAMGDEVIRSVADILKQVIGSKGFVGRFGGDEYFAMLHDIGSEGDIRNILGAVMDNISNAFKNKFEGFNITASIGIAEFPRNGDSFDILFRKADRGLYIAKNKGKRRYIIYKEQLHGEIDPSKAGESLEDFNKQKLAGDLERYKVVREGMLSLYTRGKDAVDELMQKLIKAYMLTGISLYLGEEFILYKQWGNYTKPMISADYMLDKNGLKRFNSKNIFWENNVASNDNYVPAIHDRLSEHKIFATCQCMIGTPDNIQGLMTFDLEQPLRNWTEEDLGYFGIISQFIGELYKMR